MDTMNGIRNRFKLKEDMVSDPENYLGSQISKIEVNDVTGRQFWSTSLAKYCQTAILNVDNHKNERLPTFPSIQSPTTYIC